MKKDDAPAWPTPCRAASASAFGYDTLLRAPHGRVNVRASFPAHDLVCVWDVDGARMTPEAAVALGRLFCQKG